MDLRCSNGIKFGEVADGFIEVKCRSSRCGAGAGVVVLHRFDVMTGQLLETKRFRDLAVWSHQGGKHAAEHDSAAVRPA